MKYAKAGEKRAWDVGKGGEKQEGGGGQWKGQEDVVEREMRKWDEGAGLKGFDDIW